MKKRRAYVQELTNSDQNVPLKMALPAFGLSKSSFFYQGKPKHTKRSCKPLDPALSKALLGLTKYELTLGYDKVTDYLKTNVDLHFNPKKVYRHMKQLRLLQPKVVKPQRKSQKKAPFRFAQRSEATCVGKPT